MQNSKNSGISKLLLQLLKQIPRMKMPGSNRKSKGPNGRLIAILLVFLAIWAILDPTFWYKIVSIFDYPLHYKEYKEFGIRIPGRYDVHGIDVSRYQSKVDWKRVKNMAVGDIKITFAFIKATEGSWIKDRQFDSNWENARRNGIIRGAYHFFLPDVSPKMQAMNFIKTVNLRSGDLPPVVDIEEEKGMSRAQIRQNTKEFLQILEKHYKIKPILYTNLDFYKHTFSGEEDFEKYRLWIAHYHVTNLDLPGGEVWHFWQHSDRGNVNGINERVDFNVFRGSPDELRRICLP